MANTMPKNSQDGGAAMLAGAVAPVNNLMLIDLNCDVFCFTMFVSTFFLAIVLRLKLGEPLPV